VEACPPDSHRTAQGDCACDAGLMPLNGECVNPCPAHSVFVGEGCACEEGYLPGPVHKQCVPVAKECPAHTERDAQVSKG
jgi:hypothetical protein